MPFRIIAMLWPCANLSQWGDKYTLLKQEASTVKANIYVTAGNSIKITCFKVQCLWWIHSLHSNKMLPEALDTELQPFKEKKKSPIYQLYMKIGVHYLVTQWFNNISVGECLVPAWRSGRDWEISALWVHGTCFFLSTNLLYWKTTCVHPEGCSWLWCLGEPGFLTGFDSGVPPSPLHSTQKSKRHSQNCKTSMWETLWKNTSSTNL